MNCGYRRGARQREKQWDSLVEGHVQGWALSPILIKGGEESVRQVDQPRLLLLHWGKVTLLGRRLAGVSRAEGTSGGWHADRTKAINQIFQ